jgi:hypothetical protein
MGYVWEPPEKPDWQYIHEAGLIGERFMQEWSKLGHTSGDPAPGSPEDQLMNETIKRYTNAHRDFLARNQLRSGNQSGETGL